MRFIAIKTSASAFGLLAVSGLLLSGLLLTGCSTEEDSGGDGKLVQLTYPKGGETIKEGDTLFVTWKVADKDLGEFTSVDPMISLDDGKSWNRMKVGSIAVPSAGSPSPDWGRWGWKVDSILVGGAKKSVVTSEARIRVQEYQRAEPEFISTPSNVFTIQAK